MSQRAGERSGGKGHRSGELRGCSVCRQKERGGAHLGNQKSRRAGVSVSRLGTCACAGLGEGRAAGVAVSLLLKEEA